MPRPSRVWPLLVLWIASEALVGCQPSREPPSSPPWPEVEVEAITETWASGPTTVLAADGTLLGTMEVQRCQPVSRFILPDHLVQAFEAIGDSLSCSMETDGPFSPLFEALVEDPPPLRLPEEEAARCTALKEALFPQEAPLCLPWMAMGEEWLNLGGRESLFGAWLNLADFGEGDFGVEVAAQAWLGVRASQVDLAGAALLAALVERPDAVSSPPLLWRARSRVLVRMWQRGFISTEAMQKARDLALPSRKAAKRPASLAPSVMEGVREELEERLAGSLALRRGVTVTTPLDMKLQKVASDAIEAGVKRWEQNRKEESKKIKKVMAQHGEEDPQALAEQLKAAKIPAGAYLEVPDDQPIGAVVALEALTGRVKVLLDTATPASLPQAGAFFRRRQPGSAWKTFIYTTAIASGLTQADSFSDRRYTFKTPDGGWAPKNHNDKYFGGVTLRTGLGHSLNSVAIQLLFRMTPTQVIRTARRLGISTRLKPVPALALGVSPVTLGELVTAYAAFPSQGMRVIPHYLDKVVDDSGVPVPLSPPGPGPRVLDEKVAYLMVDMLRHVTTWGTGKLARNLPFQVGGKTGTTNDSKDTWFIGFSSQLVTGVWMGFDDGSPLGGDETGGTLSLPLWLQVMKASAEASPPPDFPVPAGIEFETRSPWNGKPDPKGPRMAFISPLVPGKPQSPPRDARPLEKDEIAAIEAERAKQAYVRTGTEEGM